MKLPGPESDRGAQTVLLRHGTTWPGSTSWNHMVPISPHAATCPLSPPTEPQGLVTRRARLWSLNLQNHRSRVASQNHGTRRLLSPPGVHMARSFHRERERETQPGPATCHWLVSSSRLPCTGSMGWVALPILILHVHLSCPLMLHCWGSRHLGRLGQGRPGLVLAPRNARLSQTWSRGLGLWPSQHGGPSGDFSEGAGKWGQGHQALGPETLT